MLLEVVELEVIGNLEIQVLAPVWTASPLATCASLTASSGPNAVAVGGGGAAATHPTKTGV